MRLLLAITVCCSAAVVCIALARRFRLSKSISGGPAKRPGFSYATQEFFEAGEFRTPRALRLEQEILQQKPRRPLSEISVALHQNSSAAVPDTPAKPVQIPRTYRVAQKPAPTPTRTATATLFGQTVPVTQIDSPPSLILPKEHDDIVDPKAASLVSRPATAGFTLHRRPPQPARPLSLLRPEDLSQYNKDVGHLISPYTTPLRGSGTEGPAPAN